jgi:hypothetical protein
VFSTVTSCQQGEGARKTLDFLINPNGCHPIAGPIKKLIAELPLSVRDWVCPACGSVHDRDRNAAINLMNIAASSAVTACGAGSSDGGLAPVVKLSAMKQELSHGSFVHE